MKRILLAAMLALQLSTMVFAQGPAFVPQLSNSANAIVPQAGSTSGAFVTQLPADARPRPPQAPAQVVAPTPPPLREVRFLDSPKRDVVEELVVDQDVAIVPFASGTKPSLPLLSQGATVSLTTDDDTLPNVGAGAVVL